MKLFLCFCVGLIIEINLVLCDIIVETDDGKLKGAERTTASGKTYYSFKGVPFAKPPLGDLRFKAPVPIGKYDDVKDCTENNVICVQMSNSDTESEDCLLLNIYTPTLNTSEPKAVLFYIYGGGFMVGDAHQSSTGPDFFIDEDVIVVTTNYRVNAFGFLSTEDSTLPGNAGIKDQLLALKWTHANIKYFGGDPNKITASGSSAGAASCTFLLLNKETEGLLAGVIPQSGSAIDTWTYQRNARDVAYKIGKILDPEFNSTNSEDLLKVLIDADYKKVKDAIALNIYPHSEMSSFLFTPTIEVESGEAYFTEPQYEMVESNKTSKVPMMIGICSEEGLSFINADTWKNELKDFDVNPAKLVPGNMHINDTIVETMVGMEIRKIYVQDGLLQDHVGAGIRFLSDTAFNRGSMKFGQLHAQQNDVYFYHFSYAGKMGGADKIDIDGAGKVPHGNECRYIFRQGDNTDTSKYPEADFLTQKRLVKLWSNFVKYQNPVPEVTDLLPVLWPKIDSDGSNFVYLDINEELKVKKNLREDTYGAWNDLYKKYAKRPFDTY